MPDIAQVLYDDYDEGNGGTIKAVARRHNVNYNTARRLIAEVRNRLKDDAAEPPPEATRARLRRFLEAQDIEDVAEVSGAWVKDESLSVYVKMPPNDGPTLDEVMDKHLARIRQAAPMYTVPRMTGGGRYVAIPQIYDLHVGKLAWDESYRVEQQVADFLRAIDGMLAFIEQRDYLISGFKLPIGNDVMHVDTVHRTTTAGTPVEASTRPYIMFDATLEALTEAIRRLASIAPVDGIEVDGNHDSLLTHALCKALDATFSRAPHVTIDAGHEPRKYRRVGATALCFQHGHKVKAADMAGQFLIEGGTLVAGAQHFVVMQGHLHKQGGVYHAVTEDNGVQVRTIPSLCKSDEYHLLHGYHSGRAAELHLFHEELGPKGIYPVFPHELETLQEQATPQAQAE